jgi:hypothetical protein
MPSVIAEFLCLSEPALYTGQIYIARNFFLQSNTRVCRSKLPSGWRPRVIFLLQTLVCEDCSTKFPAIYLSLGILYSAFFLTVAIGNCMVKLVPPVNFCSDENIQTIFGTKLEDFLNYRIDYNSIS